MARKRMIDPSIWTDEGMAQLNMRQQLLYIGLFSNADDEGRLKASAAAVRLLLPTLYPGTPLDEVELDILCVISAMVKAVRYEHDGNTYIAFTNYRRWQQIQHPTRSKLPPPPADAPLIEDSLQPDAMHVRTHGGLNEDSLRSTPQVNVDQVKSDQGRLGSETGADAPPSPAQEPDETTPTKKPPRKTTIARSGFAPSDEDRAWCARDFPAVDIDAETEAFRDHFRSTGEARADWQATWKNWIRRTPQFNGRQGAKSPAARSTSRDGKLPGPEAAEAARRILNNSPPAESPPAIEAAFSYTRRGPR